MKLHIGCGSRYLEGYINADVREGLKVDRNMSATNMEFPEQSLDEIYACHMIEHLTKAEADWFLRDCRVYLKPGGVLRLELPAIDLLIERGWGKAPEEQIINALYGIQRHEGDYHKYGYTQKTIEEKLKEFGFKVIQKEIGRTGYPNNKTGIKLWCVLT